VYHKQHNATPDEKQVFCEKEQKENRQEIKETASIGAILLILLLNCLVRGTHTLHGHLT
jgi:hypothetical protein